MGWSSHIFFFWSHDLSSGKVTSLNEQVSKIQFFTKLQSKNSAVCEPLKLLSGGPLTFSTQGPMAYHRVKLQALISKFQKFTKIKKLSKTVPCASPSSYYQVVLSHFLLRAHGLSLGKVTSFNKQVSKIQIFPKFQSKNSAVCEPLKLLSGGPLTFSTRGPMCYHRVKLQG